MDDAEREALEAAEKVLAAAGDAASLDAGSLSLLAVRAITAAHQAACPGAAMAELDRWEPTRGELIVLGGLIAYWYACLAGPEVVAALWQVTVREAG